MRNRGSIKKIEDDLYVTFKGLSKVKPMELSSFEPNNFCLKHFCLLGLVFKILGWDHLKWDILYIRILKH